MSVSIQIKGIPEVTKFLSDKDKKIIEVADATINKMGFYIQAEVQDSIAGNRAEPRSVDTGRFLNSVKTTHPQLLVSSIDTNVEYAKCLEYGTSRIAPRSHFRNTVDRNEHIVKEQVDKAIKEII